MTILSIIVDVIGVVIMGWYFFNFIQDNTYKENVIIHTIYLVIFSIITSAIRGSKIDGVYLIVTLALSILLSLIEVKIMDFAEKRVLTVFGFIILTGFLRMLCVIVIMIVFLLLTPLIAYL